MFDLLGRNVKRMKLWFKWSFGQMGTPAVYYGDEIGKTNSWSFEWREAGRRLADMEATGKLSGRELSQVKEAYEKQMRDHASEPPKDRVLEKILDGRLVHRGVVDQADIASAGENPVYQGMRGLAAIRGNSKALRDGGEDIPIETLDANVGGYLRRFRTESGAIGEEVAVLANMVGQPKTVNIAKSQLSAAGRFELFELEQQKSVSFTDRGDYISLEIPAYECYYLEIQPQ